MRADRPGGDTKVGNHSGNPVDQATEQQLESAALLDPTRKADARSSTERDEQRKIRRLQLMMDIVMCVIGQDSSLSVDEAAVMVADSKKAALAMFPDKELAYNLIYKPRLQRLMRERFRIQ